MTIMPKPLRRLCIALTIGVLATVVMTIYPLMAVDRGNKAKITSIYRGEYGWFNARDFAFGLEWSGLSLMTTTLSTPLYDGELPSWSEPPPPPYPKEAQFRLGALASGWPCRTIAFRWTEWNEASRPKKSFPAIAEYDDQDTSISYAAEDVLAKTRSGGPHETTVLLGGVIANVVIYAAVVIGPVGLLMRFARYSAGKSGSKTSTSK